MKYNLEILSSVFSWEGNSKEKALPHERRRGLYDSFSVAIVKLFLSSLIKILIYISVINTEDKH